jgi:D-glycero-alpha-D-manno-heptose-7-phosphate kinase
LIGIRTPFRISFLGGGSDIESYYKHDYGCVLSTSIDKYIYIFIHKYFTDQIQVKYSKTELANNLSEINHPIVRETLKKFNLKGVDINSIADIPAGTGLGSSSAFTVSLLNALYNYVNKAKSKVDLAKEACDVEINLLKEPIGKQDQYATAIGGLNKIYFHSDGSVKIVNIDISKEIKNYFHSNLILFYYGKQRDASSILKHQKSNIENDSNTKNILKKMVALAEDGYQLIISSKFTEFGMLMNENWMLKKSLSTNISNLQIDEIYNNAIKNGALGGKLLGAGGGGFLLFYVEKENREKLKKALSPLKEFNFHFEENGTQKIFQN